jgi:hypothetical protein
MLTLAFLEFDFLDLDLYLDLDIALDLDLDLDLPCLLVLGHVVVDVQTS